MADAVTSLQVVVEGKDDTTRVLKGIESSIIRFVGAVSAALATVSVAVFPVKAAAEFQRELLNVGKTTDFTDSQLSQLAYGLKNLSYHLNVSANDLAKMAAAGGQMGLGDAGVEGILVFTDAASRLSSVLDISAEDAGNAIGRLTNIFKIAVKDSERISSLLNEISNKSTSGGADLIDMMQRIGTAGGTLSIKQAAALAATGRDLGLTAETVGTSFNKVFLDLQTKAEDIAPVLGMPVEQFSKLVTTDGIGALKLYLNALSNMGSMQRAAFAEQTTGGGRIFALVSALVNDTNNGFEILDKHLANAEAGFEGGTSAIREQERVLQGLLAQLHVLKNVFLGIAETIGRAALPYITELTKKLQEWGKSPEAEEAFARLASSIGGAATTIVSLIQSLSGLTTAFGPLLTVFEVFLGAKIVGAILNIALALRSQAKEAIATATAWKALLTGQQDVVKATVAATAKLQSDAKAKGVAAPAETRASATAGFLDKALSKKFALADETKAAYAEVDATEKKLTQLTDQRAAALARVNQQIEYGKNNMKTMMQASYDAVISSGGTKKAAQAAANATKAEVNKAILDMQARGSNYSFAFDGAIAKTNAQLAMLKTSASASMQALSGLSSATLIFTAIGRGIASAAGALLTFMSRVTVIGSIVAGFAMILDTFGMLDPIINAVKSLFGILDSAGIEEQRQAKERQKDWEAQLRMAQERGKLYDQWKKDQAAGMKGGADSTSPFNNALTRQVGLMNNINGKYVALSAEGVRIAGAVDFINLRWEETNKQLAQAKKKYEELQATKDAQANDSRYSMGRTIGKVTDKDISAAKAQVDELSASLDLMSRARSRYGADALNNEQQLAAVVQDAIEQAKQLAPLYDASGLAALKAFEQVLLKQRELEAATKARDALASTGNIAGATDKDKQAYLLAEEKARSLEMQLVALKDAYGEAQSASATAAVFMANAVPNAAEASVEKIQSMIRILGGASEGYNLALERTKEGLDKQSKEIEEKLETIKKKANMKEAMAQTSTVDINSFGVRIDDSAISAELAKIRREAEAASLPLKEALGYIKAQQSAMALETREAGALKEALSGVSQQAKDGGQALVAGFAANAALKAFTDQQIVAQRRVVEAANFNKETIKKLYEAAKTELASVIADTKKEMMSLGQYFSSRNLSLKTANFDIQAKRSNEMETKAQSQMIEAERKRLEELGLSTEEINKQVALMQEMFDWSNRIRQEQQDEARQRMILTELQRGMVNEQKAIADYAKTAAEYTEKSRAAAAAGKADEASSWATKAKEEAEKAKIAAEGLTEKLKEFKSEASKPVVGEFSAKFLVSDEDIKKAVNGVAVARTEAAKINETVLAQASSTSEKFATDQASYYNMLKTSAENYQKIIDAIVKQAPELAKLQQDMATRVLSSADGLTAVTQGLQSIANSDFRGLDKFATISAQAGAVKDIEASIKAAANTFSETVVPAGQKVSEVARDVKTTLDAAKASNEESYARMAEMVNKTSIAAKISFPDAAAILQEQLSKQTFKAGVEFTGGAKAQQNAEGGFISGPGTWTSDSILSWLSNGEYVSDAQTTAFWGPNFFANLKSIARGGSAALGSFSTKITNGLRLPAFAGGGYIGPSLAVAGGGVMGMAQSEEGGVVGRVAVDLNVGGSKVSLLGSRKEVNNLMKALHKVNRS